MRILKIRATRLQLLISESSRLSRSRRPESALNWLHAARITGNISNSFRRGLVPSFNDWT